MIPWPIAVLCAFYAILATSSAALGWNIVAHRVEGSLVWSGLWTVWSLVLVWGLAFLKPWARTLAVWASVVLMVSALGAALLVILRAHPEPRASLTATGMATVHLIVLRYLTRPHVRAWFGSASRA